MSKEAYADSLDHWAKCFRDGTLDDSFANEIAYLLEDKAHDLRVDDRQPFASDVVNVLREANIEVEDVSTDNGSVFLTLSEPEVSEDRHALSNKLITNALKRGDIK